MACKARRNMVYCRHASVAELADAPDLGSGIVRCAGSIPVARTRKKRLLRQSLFLGDVCPIVGAKSALLRCFYFACGRKNTIRPLPCSSSSAKSHAPLTGSVASALATVRCRYQLFAVVPAAHGRTNIASWRHRRNIYPFSIRPRSGHRFFTLHYYIFTTKNRPPILNEE